MRLATLCFALALAGCAHDDSGFAATSTAPEGAPASADGAAAPAVDAAEPAARAAGADPPAVSTPVPAPSPEPLAAARAFGLPASVEVARSRPELLVAWAGGHGYRSADGGRTWAPLVLPGPQWNAFLAADGTLVSVGDDRVELESPDRTRRTVRPPDGMAPHVVLVSGGWIVVVDRDWRPRIAWARLDRAPLTWRRARAPEEGLGSELRVVEATGSHVDLLDVEVNTCGSSDGIDWQRVVRLDARGLHPLRWADDALETRGWWTPGANGWLYTLDETGVVAYRHGRLVTRLGGARADPPDYGYEGFSSAASDGTGLVAVYDGRLVRLDGSTLRVLAAHVPDGFDVHAAAQDGTVLGVRGRAVVRYTAARGFEHVTVP